MADLQVALEEHLASMSDEDWAALAARVRPPADPEPGKGTHVPGLGNRPSTPTESDLLRAAEQAGDWETADRIKLAQLTKLMDEEHRRSRSPSLRKELNHVWREAGLLDDGTPLDHFNGYKGQRWCMADLCDWPVFFDDWIEFGPPHHTEDAANYCPDW